MSIYNILGYFLISLPFIGLGIFAVKTIGWKGFFTVFGIMIIVGVVVIGGAHLIALK